MSNIKYVVKPGIVKSVFDGEYHYITAYQLMELYRVNPRECVIDKGYPYNAGKNYSGLIPLIPKENGHYNIRTNQAKGA